LDVVNGSAAAPALQLRSFVSDNAAHAIGLQVSGTASNRGIQIDMGASTAGNGMSILQNGAGHALTLQSFSGTNSMTTLLSHQAGTGKALEAAVFNPGSTTQAALVQHGSTGLATGSFGNASALWAQTAGIRGGAFLASGSSANTTVLQALYSGPAGNFDGVAFFGSFAPSASYGYGVVGQGNWYGLFANGNSGASGLKTFLIDHPLDPANKYLRHFSMESSEVLNFYRGNVQLDANGMAEVKMPDYFDAINISASYQLTPLGGPAQLFIASELNSQGIFVIAGGSPGQKVCWQVTAQRNDPFVQQNAEMLETEPLKRSADQGLYLHPELYGKPVQANIFDRNKVSPETR
jgi:hypothetical protein